MAWTSPMTAVAFEPFTAAEFNTHVRDNLLETAPAKATGAGGLIITDGANSVVQRTPDTDFIDARETTTSNSYTNLATHGPTVTVTTGTSAYVSMKVTHENNVQGFNSYVSVAVDGATSIPANDDDAQYWTQPVANYLVAFGSSFIITGLTPGSNIFTLKYRVNGSTTGAFRNRRISVIPL